MISRVTPLALSNSSQIADINRNSKIEKHNNDTSKLAYSESVQPKPAFDDAVRVTLSRSQAGEGRTREVQFERDRREITTYKPGKRQPRNDNNGEQRLSVEGQAVSAESNRVESKSDNQSKLDNQPKFEDAPEGRRSSELTIEDS